MVFKKEDEKTWYCVGIITKDGMNYEGHEGLAEKIMNSVNNVGILSGFVKEQFDPQQLQILYKRFYQPDFSSPCIVINEINHDDIRKETERLEQKHKWRKLFRLIAAEEYQAAEDRAIFDFNKILLFTEDADQAIEFLKKRE